MQGAVSRTREIGLRMALGASRNGIARLMLIRTTTLLSTGLAAGAVITLLLRRLVASVLVIQFERDGLIIAALVALLALVGILAALVPISRAAAVDPIQALRTE